MTEEKPYCNIYISVFGKSKDEKGCKEVVEKLEKLLDDNFDNERKNCDITMATRYPF
jgi:hypothetical protein|tara:strand:+ start:341 stop:511 length:171 start_codon:yes stop_codon:yes gene_type:complete